MIYLIYAKGENDKRFRALDLQHGCYASTLFYATMWSCKEAAHKVRNELSNLNPGKVFQVRASK